ncbi:unnamed protein product [Musa hybrid cultivar]
MPQYLFYDKLACAPLGPISTLVTCGAPDLLFSCLRVHVSLTRQLTPTVSAERLQR